MLKLRDVLSGWEAGREPAGGGGKGAQGCPDPGRPRAGPARHRSHRGLFAASLGALGADRPHPAGPPVQGAEARRHHYDEAANRFFEEDYLPRHNARFAIAPAEAGCAFVPDQEVQWRDVLAVQEERTVAPHNTAAWKDRRLQIPAYPARAHIVRAKVRVHDHFDGELAIFHGPRCLVRWRPDHDEGEDAADSETLQPQCEPLAPQPEACGKPGRAVPARPPFPRAQHHQAVKSYGT